jgi:hypothetical protein
MALSTASTVALLVATRARARARHATQDTEGRAVRQPALALLLRTRARTGVTATSTASTVALLVEPLARALARLATRDTKA